MDFSEKVLRWSADRFRVCRPLYYHNPGNIPTVREMDAKVLVENTLSISSHTRRMPVWASKSVLSEFTSCRQVQINAKPLYLLKDVEMIGPSGFIKNQEGRFPLEQAWGSQAVLENRIEYQRRWWGKPKIINEPVFHLSGLYAENYFHWIHDILPRLFGTIDLLPPNVRWLVPSSLLEFQKSTLARLNIKKERFFPIDAGHYRFSTLYYSPYWGNTAFDAPEVTKWLRSKFSGSLNNHSPQTNRKKIYLSRQQSARRKIVNQQEVENALEKMGFETVFTEKLNFKEQQSLFSQAEIVCSVHGAGLTNLLFCPPGTACVEIHGTPVRDALQYWSIADSADLDYAIVVGQRQSSGHNDDDLQVDIAELSEAIHFMLARTLHT